MPKTRKYGKSVAGASGNSSVHVYSILRHTSAGLRLGNREDASAFEKKAIVRCVSWS